MSAVRSRRDVEWADGIRGLASMCVVTSHSVRAFLPNYLSPADAVDATPHLFQLPFFRIHSSGPLMISIFFILSGYVCAIKPIRLSTAGQPDESRRVIASSAFRRCLRIGLPATFVTIFAWALAQMGTFALAPVVELEGMWLERTTPKRIPGFFASIKELITQCFNTWALSDNTYEANLWSLGWEMRGAMLVYLILTISVNCTPPCRRFILVTMTTFYFKSGEFIPPFLFLSGACLAEITLIQIAHNNNKVTALDVNEPPRGLRRLVNKCWTGALFVFSMYLGTHPPENPHRATYSRVMHDFFNKYITTEGGDSSRTIAAFAGIGIILSIMFSPGLKRFFSNPKFVHVGSISFPLYLLHGTYIRLPLAWGFFRLLPTLPWLNILEETHDSKGEPVILMECNSFGCVSAAIVMYILWFMMLLMFCRFWKAKVDIHGITFSKWAEDIFTGKRQVSASWMPPLIGRGLWRVDERLNWHGVSEKSANGLLA